MKVDDFGTHKGYIRQLYNKLMNIKEKKDDIQIKIWSEISNNVENSKSINELHSIKNLILEDKVNILKIEKAERKLKKKLKIWGERIDQDKKLLHL